MRRKRTLEVSSGEQKIKPSPKVQKFLRGLGNFSQKVPQ